MSTLRSIEKPQDRPIIATICGDSGMGKTSLAATFPNPIVIRGEDGLQAIPMEQRPDAFPILKNPDQLWEQISDLIKEDHDYKTLIVDSVTALERMFIQSVIESDPKQPRSINLRASDENFTSLADMASTLDSIPLRKLERLLTWRS